MIDETNTFQLKFLPSIKLVGVTGLWALKRAWQKFFLCQSIGIDENNTGSIDRYC